MSHVGVSPGFGNLHENLIDARTYACEAGNGRACLPMKNAAGTGTASYRGSRDRVLIPRPAPAKEAR